MTQQKILTNNPYRSYQSHASDIKAAIDRVLKSGRYVLGPEVAAFENEMASYLGVNHAIGVACGTDALYLALKAHNLQKGDEVLVASFTAVATIHAITQTGATPVFVDVDPNFYTIDPQQAQSLITPQTKAIVAVHLYGQTCDMDALQDMAQQHHLTLIEDGAQAVGATWQNQKLGSIGNAGCFSFYPTKNLSALGDAGLVVTNNKNTAEKIRQLRQYGWVDRLSQTPGINSRCDEIQAAILRVKLKTLDADNANKIKTAQFYQEYLTNKDLVKPQVRPNTQHVFHQYVIQTDKRDALQQHLATHDIDCQIHYPVASHQHPAFQNLINSDTHLKTTESLVGRVLSLPIDAALTDEEKEKIIAGIKTFKT